jgi:complement component 1 Q subcomponent-binding protein
MFRPIKFLIRSFAINRSFSSLANKRLVKALEKELEYEQSQYKVDESVAPFLQESGFEIIDLEGSTQVILKKKMHGNDVEVAFNARSPYNEEGNEQNEGEENQEEEAQDNSTDFQVTIKKSGRKEGLIYECLSSQSEIHINNIVYNDDVTSIERATTFVSGGEYRGPEFSTLDEKLQTAFVEYMKSHGIDEDLAVFVETYSLDKEHRLYMEWIGKMKGFVSN